MPQADDTSSHASVQQWVRGLEEQWGERPSDIDARFTTLSAFSEFTGKAPDEMIAECTREVESGKRIRIKARRLYSDKIAEFQAVAAGDARQQGRAGNTVRSFFIHNGIFMQAGVQG